MIKDKELNKAITTITPKRERDFKVVRYDYRGKDDESKPSKLLDSQSAIIASETSTGFTYKIRIKRGGKLYNPFVDGDLKRMDKITNDSMFKFRPVNNKAFENYLQFLRTGNEPFYLVAQRETK